MSSYMIRCLPPVAAFCLGLLLAPLLPGVINRVKAHMAGRKGKPVLQLYYDLAKLWRKKPVYSNTTTWVFTLGPVISLAAVCVALLMTPFASLPAVIFFRGDFFLLGALLALGRFCTILAALDTGSAFEGMGAAREALFSALAEPVFLLCLVIISFPTGRMSLSTMLSGTLPAVWAVQWPFFMLLAISLFLILLTENSRIPVDDPNTHLELTMIHEVMVLDHSGPDLALIEYAASLKLWLFCLIIAGLMTPLWGGPFFAPGQGFIEGKVPAFAFHAVVSVCYIFLVAILVGLVESVMARLRMFRVPQLLTLAGSFAFLAGLLIWR